MDCLHLGLALPATFALGILPHVAWFIRGEHDFYSRKYAFVWAASQAVGFHALTKLAEQTWPVACVSLLLLSLVYFTSVFASMAVYRVFFHRLKRFPGPLSWRINKLAQVIANPDSKGYRHLHRLHERYGDYVCIGPRDLNQRSSSARGGLRPGH